MRKYINKYDDEDDDENARDSFMFYMYIFIQKQIIF